MTTHPCALDIQRYVQGMNIGDRVKVRLRNGYEDFGTVVRFYKNGAIRVREDRGHTINRRPEDLTVVR